MIQSFRTPPSVRCLALALGVGFVAPSCVDDDDPESNQRVPTVAVYAPSNSDIPIPNDLLYSGSTDATLNLPVDDPTDLSDPFIALNSLDGWSTTAPISVNFSRAIDPETIFDTGTSTFTGAIRMFEVSTFVSPTAPVGGPVTGINAELTAGIDFLPVVVRDSTVVIQPLARLNESTLGSNSVYMVVVTDELLDTAGRAVAQDREFLLAAVREPYGSGTSASLRALQQIVDAQLLAFEAFEAATPLDPMDPKDRDRVAVSFTFTTQSIGAALDSVVTIADGFEQALINTLCPMLGTCGGDTMPNQFSDPQIRVTNAAMPIGTAQELAGGPPGGIADIYAGVFEAPYYLTAADNPSLDGNAVVVNELPLTETWQSRYAPPAGGDDRNLTRFNPLPNATSAQKMPILVSIPNNVAPPPNGFPVVIFQHGIGADRRSLLGVAEALAAAQLAAVAIDMPLHGVNATTGVLATGANIFVMYRQDGADVWERTFGLDLLDDSGAFPVSGQDGVADDSGSHFINLSNVAVSRDNVRQAVSDLVNLRTVIGDLTIMGNDVFDETQVHFMGHSMGGIVGVPFINAQTNLTMHAPIESSILGMPGSAVPYLLNGSVVFGPIVRAGLAAAGVEEGTEDFDLFLAASQTIVDTVDPINHAESAAATGQPILLFEIVGGGPLGGATDIVVPNSVPGAPFAGTEPLAAALGLASISDDTTIAGGIQGIVRFVEGDHSSLATPGLTATTMAAYAEMQTMMSQYHATGGTNVVVTDTNLVQ